LRRCVELDANLAECHFLLGEAYEWTDEPRRALSSYYAAIEHDPRQGVFYPSLAALYLTFKLEAQAETTLSEGLRLVPAVENARESIYEIHVLLSQVAQAKGDPVAMLAAMEAAYDVGGEAHPEMAFNLGSTYAIQEPPQREKAVRLLHSFRKRACRNQQFREQCETAVTLLQALEQPG
jgi:tetratricopeptide (TPR) repeat protein